MKNVKNYFIAVALCMGVNVPVHGVDAKPAPVMAPISVDALRAQMDDGAFLHMVNMLKDEGLHVDGPTLKKMADQAHGTVRGTKLPKVLFPAIGKYLGGPLSFEYGQHDVMTGRGHFQLPVAFMKKGDTVVAAYINDTRPTGDISLQNLQNSQVSTLIRNLHNQHGTNLPILVNTPHRNPSFSEVTGTLYSSAKKIEVSSSHDLTMHGGTGSTVTVGDHTGDLRTNADHVTIHNPINVNLTCDNKKAVIKIPIPYLFQAGYRGVVTLNDHQGTVMASGDTITVKMKNHSGDVEIGHKAKAIIENAEIDLLLLHDDGDALIVNGQIKALLSANGGTAWLVDSTVNESHYTSDQSEPDIYPINTEGDLSTAPGMLETQLKDKDGSNEDKQKTMTDFDKLWNQRQMPHKHIPEEHKE